MARSDDEEEVAPWDSYILFLLKRLQVTQEPLTKINDEKKTIID